MIVCRYSHTDQPLTASEQAKTDVWPSDVLSSDMKGGDVRVAVVQCRAVDATEAQGRMVLWVTEPTGVDTTTKGGA